MITAIRFQLPRDKGDDLVGCCELDPCVRQEYRGPWIGDKALCINAIMDDGKVIMDGIPKEIFSRVKELKEHGLDVPQATELAFELKEAGMPLTEGILSRQELVEQLTALLSDEK